MSDPRIDPSYLWHPTPNTSGRRLEQPTVIVLHYTADESFNGAVTWLCDPQAKASAHFVVGRTGEVAQLASVESVTWHAGKSSWNGRRGVNSYSIGIELVNLGPLLEKTTRIPSFVSVAGGKPVPASDVYCGKHLTAASCPYEHWQQYTAEQIEKTRQLIAQVRAEYPSITEVIAHSDVAHKIDVGPALVGYGLLTHEPRPADLVA